MTDNGPTISERVALLKEAAVIAAERARAGVVGVQYRFPTKDPLYRFRTEHCPTCGARLSAVATLDQTHREAAMLRAENTKLVGELAKLRASDVNKVIEDLAAQVTALTAELGHHNVYWYQRKVGEQSRIIRKLEDKLRRKGVEPYGEELL